MHRLTEQKRHALDLLCRAGVGLAPIAPDVCRLVREMVGAEACGLYWLDAHGQLEGFFHELALPAVQALFLSEHQRLFSGAGDLNVDKPAHAGDPSAGASLSAPSAHCRCHAFHLPAHASGQHHSLDLRVDVAGHARAVLLLVRAAPSFSPRDIALLQRVEPYLQHAVAHLRDVVYAAPEAGCTGYLLLDASGQRLLMLSADAQRLLQSWAFVGRNLELTPLVPVVPRFLRELCCNLNISGQFMVRRVLDIPGGWLVLTARRLCAPALHGASPLQTLVTLEQITPPRLQVVKRVLALSLSPLQREIALYAGMGGLRADCEPVMGVSHEALKKHLKTIYRVAGVSGWEGLTTALKSAPVVM